MLAIGPAQTANAEFYRHWRRSPLVFFCGAELAAWSCKMKKSPRLKVGANAYISNQTIVFSSTKKEISLVWLVGLVLPRPACRYIRADTPQINMIFAARGGFFNLYTIRNRS